MASLLLALMACDDREPSVPPSPQPGIEGSLTLNATDGSRGGNVLIETIDCENDPVVCDEVAEDPTLQPVAPNTNCTMQFGGPESATLTGEVEGQTVNLKFGRSNGCEIARYEHLQEILQALETPIDLPMAQGGDIR